MGNGKDGTMGEAAGIGPGGIGGNDEEVSAARNLLESGSSSENKYM